MRLDLSSLRAAARASGIPRGTLIGRTRGGLTLAAAVALGARTQEEAHPRSPARQAREAAGVPRTTAQRRRRLGLAPDVVLHGGALSRGEAKALAEERAGFLAAALTAGLEHPLASALPTAAASALGGWAALPLSARVLWVLRGAPQRARDIERLLGEDHRRINNVLSGLRTRGLVEAIGKVRKAPGYGPALVPLWRATEKGRAT